MNTWENAVVLHETVLTFFSRAATVPPSSPVDRAGGRRKRKRDARGSVFGVQTGDLTYCSGFGGDRPIDLALVDLVLGCQVENG